MHCLNHQLNLNVANTFKMTSLHNLMEKIREMTVFQLITDKGTSFTIAIRNGKIVWKHGPYLAEL